MNSLPWTITRYSIADIIDDKVVSALSVALFVMVMTPPALLYAAKSSLITAWTLDISRDVSNREIVIRGGRNSNQWLSYQDLEQMRSWPEVSFVTPEPSFSVRAHEWTKVIDSDRQPPQEAYQVLSMRTTLSGDPIFSGHAIPNGMDEVALSHAAAKMLDVSVGDYVKIKIIRQSHNRMERQYLKLNVVTVLDEADWVGVNTFVAPEIASAIRAYQYHEITHDQFPSVSDITKILWPSIRIYSKSIHVASALRDRLSSFGFDDPRLRSDQIERLKIVEDGINGISRLVIGFSAFGLLTSIFFYEWLASQRKKNEISILVVLGFSLISVGLMRLLHSMILLGTSASISLLVTMAAEDYFESAGRALLGLNAVTPIPLANLLVAGLLVIIIGATGSILGTWRISATDLTAAVRKD